MAAIVEHIQPSAYYSDGSHMAASQADQLVLRGVYCTLSAMIVCDVSDLVKKHLPRVFQHFEGNNIEMQMITLNWYV